MVDATSPDLPFPLPPSRQSTPSCRIWDVTGDGFALRETPIVDVLQASFIGDGLHFRME